MSESNGVRAIAFYLPQYHPIPENDQWWGKGFTEWTNVAKARPLFPWHEQPHLPADLGFYDLRLPEVREAQADLAREYGLHGFCYYHYWFGGRRLLERPFNEVLDSGRPDFPFCLCWANENWTRVWDGGESHVLLEQQYSEEDDRRHGRWLCRAFEDPRYIRVNGKPVFLVYRISRLPNPKRTAEIWREEAQRQGVGEIVLCHVQSFPTEPKNPAAFGFDAAVEFQPTWGRLGRPMHQDQLGRWLGRLNLVNRNYSDARVYEYSDVVSRMLARERPDYPLFPCVTPMWDNSARRQNGALLRGPTLIRGSTPELYERWLSRVISGAMLQQAGLDLVFINAWNEWAEGNHLEPCQRWGRSYLEATRRALSLSAARAASQREWDREVIEVVG